MNTNTSNVTPPAAEEIGGESARMSGEDRRRQLIRVAMHLFSQKGFTGTTTKEIAAAACVNEAIIFRHFASKDDFYAAILDFKAHEVCAGDWLEELREVAAGNDDERLFRFIAEKKLTLHRRDEHDQFLRLMFYSALEGHTLAHIFLERQARPVHEFLCGYVERRQREGVFRADVHPRAAVNTFIGAMNHHVMMRAFFKNWSDFSDDDVVTNLTSLLLGGLRAIEPQAVSSKAKTAPPRNKSLKKIGQPSARNLKQDAAKHDAAKANVTKADVTQRRGFASPKPKTSRKKA